MRYFTWEECIYSSTADAHRIDNQPDEVQRQRIIETVESLLDPLRESWEMFCAAKGWGSPQIRISSGFRSARLNALVRGAATSAHCLGWAFDLVPVNGRMADFKAFCRAFLADRLFDQMISEDEDENGTPRWIHIGYKTTGGKQRRQLLSMRNGGYSVMS